MIKTKLIRAGVFLAGFGFVAGATLFAFAWFTVSIPDPNAYVNSQSTIIQYSNGSEIGRIGTQNRQVLPLAKIPLRRMGRADEIAGIIVFLSSRAGGYITGAEIPVDGGIVGCS